MDQTNSITSQDVERVLNTPFTGFQPQLKEVSTYVASFWFIIDSLPSRMGNFILRVKTTEKAVEDLSKKVETAEGRINKLESQNSRPQSVGEKVIVRRCMLEIVQRNAKKINLFPSSVINVLYPCVIPANQKINEAFKMGVFLQQQVKPCPVKVVCETEESAHALLHAFLEHKKYTKIQRKSEASFSPREFNYEEEGVNALTIHTYAYMNSTSILIHLARKS